VLRRAANPAAIVAIPAEEEASCLSDLLASFRGHTPLSCVASPTGTAALLAVACAACPQPSLRSCGIRWYPHQYRSQLYRTQGVLGGNGPSCPRGRGRAPPYRSQVEPEATREWPGMCRWLSWHLPDEGLKKFGVGVTLSRRIGVVFN